MAASMTEGAAQRFYRETKEKFEAQAKRLKAKAVAADATTKQVVLEVLASLEVGGTAFAFGFVRGYYGEKKLLSVPLELWATLALHGVGLVLDFKAPAGNAGDWDRMVARQLHNLGNGALAAYSTTLGASMGAEMKSKAQQAPNQFQGAATSGVMAGAEFAPGRYLPQGNRHEPFEPVTSAEMTSMLA